MRKKEHVTSVGGIPAFPNIRLRVRSNCTLALSVWACMCVAALSQAYLYESGQQHTAHLLLQDDLVLGVVVAGRDEGREENFDEARVAEVLKGQLTQFLQHAGLTARLHYHLEHTQSPASQSLSQPVSRIGSCKSQPLAPPPRKSATKTTHKHPLGGELEGTASHCTITGYKTR